MSKVLGTVGTCGRGMGLCGWILIWILFLAVGDAGAAQNRLTGTDLFDAVWQTVSESYAGPGLSGLDWHGVWTELRPQAEKAQSLTAAYPLIQAMLARLRDPLTYFVTPDQVTLAKKAQQAEGRLDVVGVGIMLGQMPDGHILVREVLAKGPAAKGKVVCGDRITGVDHKPTKGLAAAAVADMIRGDKASKVTLTLLDSRGQSRDVILQRAAVSFVSEVRSQVLSGNLGYLYLPGGGDGFEITVLSHLRKLHKTDGLILDLRSGWTGDDLSHMTPMLRIAALFTDQDLGALISRQGVHMLTPQLEWEHTSPTSWLRLLLTPPPTFMDVYRKPLVVLVDDSSTWEILAMGLQATGRARVVGRPTMNGRGVLATGFEFADGSALSVTVTYYTSPAGKTLADGMRPDIHVPFDARYLNTWYEGEDPDILAARNSLAQSIAVVKSSRK